MPALPVEYPIFFSRELMSRTFLTWFASLFCLTLGIFLANPLTNLTSPPTTLIVNSRIDDGKNLEIYINNNFESPLHSPIPTKKRHHHVLKDVPAKITSLRIDPTDVVNSDFRICSIFIKSGGHSSSRIDGAQLTTWQVQGARLIGLDRGCAHFSSLTNDPFIWSSNLTFDANALNPYGNDLWQKSLLVLLLTTLGGLLFSILVAVPIRYFISIPFIVGALITVPTSAVVNVVQKLPFAPPAIDKAIGFVSFFGYPKVVDNLGFLAALSIYAICGVILGLALRSLGCTSNALTDSPLPKGRTWPIIVIFILIAIATFPKFNSTPPQLSANDFDFNNILTWNYAYHRGELVFRDFWFPYFGQISQLGPFPSDLMHIYLHNLLLSWIFIFALYKILDCKIMPTLLISATIWLGCEWGLFLGVRRYFVGLSFLLYYAAILLRGQLSNSNAIICGLIASWIFLYEPNQLVYIFPGSCLLFIMAVRLPRVGKITNLDYFVWHLKIGALLLACVAISLIGLFINGQLASFLQFLSEMGALATRGSLPAPLYDWFELGVGHNRVLTLGLHLLLLTSITSVIIAKSPRLRFQNAITLAICLTVTMLFAKLLVRPHMALQIIGLLVVAVGFHFFNNYKLVGPFTKLSVLLFLGIFIGNYNRAGQITGAIRNAGVAILTSPSRFESFIHRPSESDFFEKYFAVENFIGLSNDAANVAKYINANYSNPNCYVFGDESYFYPLLNIRTPKYITFYDGATLAAQEELLDSFKKNPPEIIIFNPEFKQFDSVPNQVRVPLLYSFLVTKYRKSEVFGRFEILTPRLDNKTIDLNYWVSKLGDSIDLQEVPYLSNFKGSDGCSDKNCFDFVELQIKTSISNPEVTLTFIDKEFKIKFAPNHNRKTAYINLSRLWFWNIIKARDRTDDLVISANFDHQAQLYKLSMADPFLY